MMHMLAVKITKYLVSKGVYWVCVCVCTVYWVCVCVYCVLGVCVCTGCALGVYWVWVCVWIGEEL